MDKRHKVFLNLDSQASFTKVKGLFLNWWLFLQMLSVLHTGDCIDRGNEVNKGIVAFSRIVKPAISAIRFVELISYINMK